MTNKTHHFLTFLETLFVFDVDFVFDADVDFVF